MSLRRFSFAAPLFVLLWALYFALPPLRLPALSQWRARLGLIRTDTPPGLSRDADFMRAIYGDPAPQQKGANKGDRRQLALAALGDKYPNDAAICAAQIIMARGLYNARHTGTYSRNPNWSVRREKVVVPSPETLRSWFAATARGAKLEPNNTFWDWAQLIGLIAAHRDTQIWPVLRAASHKTAYDDHLSDLMLADLRQSKQQRGILSPNFQLGSDTAVLLLLLYLDRVREAAEQMDDIASGLHLQNTPQSRKQALAGMRDLVLLARIMRLESKLFLSSNCGQAVEETALSGGTYSASNTKSGARLITSAPLSLYSRSSRSLLSFARLEGRSDIAAQLTREWNSFGVWNSQVLRPSFRGSSLGVSRDAVVAQTGHSIGKLLLAGIPALLICALLCSAALRFVPAWRRESALQPTPASWLWGTMLGFWTLLCLVSPIIYLVYNGFLLRTPLLRVLVYALTNPKVHPVPASWQTYFSVAIEVLLALWFAALWQANRQGKPSLVTRLRRLFETPADGISRFDISPLLVLAATITCILASTLGVLAYLIVSAINSDYQSWYLVSSLVLVAVLAIFALPLLLSLRTPAARAFALVLARRFAWSQLLFFTVAWGALWMFAAPDQQRFDADYNRFLQVGEIQLLRKAAGL